MAKQSKAMEAAVSWVRELMDLLGMMDGMDKRTAKAAMKLLRAGCADTVYNKEIALWHDNISSITDLDTGEALLALSNRLAWNADQERYSLEDIYKEFGE